VKQQHCKHRALACGGVFEHLLITRQVAERRMRPAADPHVDAVRFVGVVVVQQSRRLFGQEWPAAASSNDVYWATRTVADRSMRSPKRLVTRTS